MQYGLPPETDEEIDLLINLQRTTLRGTIWMILLDIGPVDPINYFKLVSKGPSKFLEKISLVRVNNEIRTLIGHIQKMKNFQED